MTIIGGANYSYMLDFVQIVTKLITICKFKTICHLLTFIIVNGYVRISSLSLLTVHHDDIAYNE